MKNSLKFLGIFALALPLMFLGCGDNGSQGPAGPQGPEGPQGPGAVTQVTPETCATCHNGDFARNGDAHQAAYDQLYQDNVVVVSNLAYSNDNVSDTVTFTMTKAGVDFPCTNLDPAAGDSLGIYFVGYDNATRTFENDNAIRLSLGTAGNSSGSTPSTLSYSSGVCTSTVPQSFLGNLDTQDGLIVLYGRNETIGSIPNSRVQQDKYPFAALLETGPDGVTYTSAANVSGCEKCHIVPFLKHGYIYGEVNHDPANDFYTCKACHQDNGDGGHFIWQLLVSDPQRAAAVFAGTSTTSGSEDADFMTAAEIAQYAYKTRLMNDVHMSHAMEFAYPQSMSNCATCHAGKLNMILTDANFTAETCKSCHAVTGPGKEKQAPSLQTIWIEKGVDSFSFHDPTNLLSCNTTGCHAAGGSGKTFSQIHTGYDPIIYADAAGTKYSDAITVSIDNASFSDNTKVLSFSFSASGSVGSVSSADIVPTILVGLYGYNTKDYIQGPHESDPLGSGNRALEWDGPTGSGNSPYITVNGGDVTVDLSQVPQWAGWIDNGTVRRVEIAIMPTLSNPALPDVAKEREGPPHGGTVNQDYVALNAPSRTFDLTTNAFVDNYFEGTNALVKVDNGCNNCHGALGVGFHAPDRGGNIVVCRLCHVVKSGASHLEMQSRSIDSYVHSIHSFQAFNISSINFDNAVQSMEYTHHIDSHFPTFGREDCLACHNAGKFNVPDQSKSLPGVLSASASHATLAANGFDRNIGDIPSYTTGPASRACGGCHRADPINEDNAGDLASFNGHVEHEGYLVENGDILTIINEIFSQL